MGIQLTQNFSQYIDNINNAVFNQMNRTFYVDAVNGDDNNDGSESSPFRTIQKAVDSIPVGGFVSIILKSDYTGVFNARLKKIYIKISSGKTWTIPEGSCCDIGSCSIEIRNSGKLIISRSDGSNINPDNYAGFWVNDHESDKYLEVTTNLYLLNVNTTDPVKIDSDRCLFGSRVWGVNQNIQMNLAIFNLYCNGNFMIDGCLLRLQGGCGSFQWNSYANDSSFKVVDSNGNSVDVKSKINGIIRDSNGIPRNILSNIIL